MKHQTINKILLQTLLATLIFLSSCKRDMPDTHCQIINNYYEIPSSERPVFIYKGGEKLTFISHPQLDTLVYTSSKLDSGYNITSSQTDCPTQYHRKWLGITFNGINNASNSTVQCYVTVDNSGFYNSDIFVYYKQISFYADTWSCSNPNYWKTFTINNKVYAKVTTLTPYSYTPPGKAALYDRDSGIVKIEFADSSYIELLKKE